MEEIQLISQYGIVGFLGYFFIREVFVLLKNKKNGNGEQDEKQDTDLARIDERLKNIELQVSNHLPTAMRALSEKLDKHIENQNYFERDIISKISKI